MQDDIAPELLDPVIAGAGWIAGLMALGVALSAIGFAWWWAGAMGRPDLPRVIGRAFVGGLGLGCLLVGSWALAIATEVSLGYPLGDSSGGGAVLAYWVTLETATREMALTAGLLRRASHPTLAGFSWVATAGCHVLAKVMLLFVLVVAFAQLLQ